DHELPRLFRRDDAREGLLDQLVRTEPEQGEHGVVGLVDLALEIGYEDRVRRVLDQALGVGARLVELAHVAQDADGPDDVAVGVAKGRGVERGGDHLAGRAPRLESDVSGDAALDHLAERHHELARLVGAEEPGDRLLEDLVAPQTEQARDGAVRLEDLALQVANEDGIRRIRDDDVSGERGPGGALHHGRQSLRHGAPLGPTYRLFRSTGIARIAPDCSERRRGCRSGGYLYAAAGICRIAGGGAI